MSARETPVSRRAFLVGAAALTASCTTHTSQPAADPDAAALALARDGEARLLAAYAPGTPAHSAHLAHLRALGGTPPSSGPATPAADAATAERASVPTLQAAAETARRGATAALLAAVAASHAVLGGVPSAS